MPKPGMLDGNYNVVPISRFRNSQPGVGLGSVIYGQRGISGDAPMGGDPFADDPNYGATYGPNAYIAPGLTNSAPNDQGLTAVTRLMTSNSQSPTSVQSITQWAQQNSTWLAIGAVVALLLMHRR